MTFSFHFLKRERTDGISYKNCHSYAPVQGGAFWVRTQRKKGRRRDDLPNERRNDQLPGYKNLAKVNLDSVNSIPNATPTHKREFCIRV